MFSMFNRKPKAAKVSAPGKPDPSYEDHAGPTPLHPPLASEALPSLRAVAISERPPLLRKKLALCTVVYDFTDHTKDLKEKERKRQTLSEILDYVSSPGPNKITSHSATEDFFRMVSANIFRPLPFPLGFTMPTFPALDAEEDELCLDPAWQHLQYVYECLLRFVHESDAKTAKKYIDHSFVLHLMDLFDTEDLRERESLKMILHRIYGKFMVHRPFIRKAINNIFYRFIFESENHNGTGELLEILGSIINGFALPLKEEHKIFLARTLIPLHKPRSMPSYHQQLSYCVVQFVEKDFKLAEHVILGLVKYWPLTNSQKEVLILGELEEVLEATHAGEFQRCMVPLFKKIRRSLTSSHFQVAERALLLWNNDHILRLIQQNYRVILPLVFGALEINSHHWNSSVHGLTQSVKQMFQDMDEEFFYKCRDKFYEEEAEAKAKEEEREKIWKTLEAATAGSLPAHLSC